MRQQIKQLITVGVLTLTVLALSLWLGPLLRTTPPLQAAPLLVPANDNLASPVFVSTIPFTATNIDMATASAVLETNEADCGGGDSRSVWYSYTPPVTGTLTITSSGAGDTTIGLYRPTNPAMPAHPLNEVDCNDVAADGVAEVVTQMVTQTTYYVRVGSFDTNPANVEIKFTSPPKVAVKDGSFNTLTNNGTVNVDMTVGAPWVMLFTVSNEGVGTNLVLSNLTASGTGISIVQGLGSTSLAGNSGGLVPDGKSTTFKVQVNPTAAGAINGSVTITSNDNNTPGTNFVINLTGTARAMPTTPTGTRQVATTGTDSGDCQANPCKTITYALGQATHGNLITIASGTYTNPLVITKTVTLQGAGSGSTIVNGKAQFGGSTTIKIATGQKVTISGVTITGGVGSKGGGVFNDGNLTLDDVIITNNSLSDH